MGEDSKKIPEKIESGGLNAFFGHFYFFTQTSCLTSFLSLDIIEHIHTFDYGSQVEPEMANPAMSGFMPRFDDGANLVFARGIDDFVVLEMGRC